VLKKLAIGSLFIAAILVAFIAGAVITPVLAAKPTWGTNTFFEAYRLVKQEFYRDDVQDDKMIYAGIKGMLSSLDDPYTRFMDPEAFKSLQNEIHGSFGGVGMQLGITNPKKDKEDLKSGKLNPASMSNKPEDLIRMSNGKEDGDKITVIAPIEDSPAYKAGIKAGDIVVKVNGISIKGMALDEVVAKIRGPIGTKVKIDLERNGQLLPTFELNRENIEIKSVKAKMLDSGVGYLRLTSFADNSADEMKKAFKNELKGAKAVIIDLRGNPGGSLYAAIDIASGFIKSGTIVSQIDRNKHKQNMEATGDMFVPEDVYIVVLVDKGSASASEILSGALQDYKRATIMGTTTFGKGLVQTVHTLSDGSGIAITTAKYLTPNDRDINKKGIEPDIRVEFTEKDIQNKNDVQLKKAEELAVKHK
jgi:carboxyl-terminal processing protease